LRGRFERQRDGHRGRVRHRLAALAFDTAMRLFVPPGHAEVHAPAPVKLPYDFRYEIGGLIGFAEGVAEQLLGLFGELLLPRTSVG
jgi:hypothetical protein